MEYFNKWNKIIVLVFCVAFTQLCYAATDQNEAEYNKAFNEYAEQKTKNLNTTDLVPFAKKLYQSGVKKFAGDNFNLAMLAFIYADVLISAKEEVKGQALLEESISLYEQLEEKPYERLSKVYLQLGKMLYVKSKTNKKGVLKLTKAIAMAEKTGNELLLANIKLNVGIIYLSQSFPSRKIARQALQILTDSYQTFRKKPDQRKNVAAFWLGKVNMFLSDNSTAAEYFNYLLDNPQDGANMAQLEMSSHAFLVDVYSKLGEDELATKHCLAIGEMQPWGENSEAKPLYKLPASYPREAAMKGIEGWVKLGLTIDKFGFAKDVEVVEMSGGSNYFSRSAKKAITKWRFAPRFVDGVAVDSKSTYTMQFQLAPK